MSNQVQSFSPALLGGLLLRPIPLSLLRRLARPALARAERLLAPQLSDRLEGLAGTVAIVPTGWPVALVLTVGAGGLEADLSEPDAPATAVVRAPVEVLVGMLDGAQGLDGDASLFSRLLTIEGDTGLVMALRYALEDGGIDASSLLTLAPAPLRPVLPRAAALVQRVHAAASRDLATIQQAVLAPLRTDLARQEARLSRLEQDAARRRR